GGGGARPRAAHAGLLSAMGWQVALLALGGLFLLIVAPLNALLQRWRPEDYGLLPDGERHRPSDSIAAGRPGAAPPGPTWTEALRHPRFWALAAGLLLGGVPLQLILSHGFAYLTDQGFSPHAAAMALGVGGVFTAGGNVLWGYLADRWSAEWAYTLASVAVAVGIALLAVVAPGREVLLYGYVVLFALGFGWQGLISAMGRA